MNSFDDSYYTKIFPCNLFVGYIIAYIDTFGYSALQSMIYYVLSKRNLSDIEKEKIVSHFSCFMYPNKNMYIEDKFLTYDITSIFYEGIVINYKSISHRFAKNDMVLLGKKWCLGDFNQMIYFDGVMNVINEQYLDLLNLKKFTNLYENTKMENLQIMILSFIKESGVVCNVFFDENMMIFNVISCPLCFESVIRPYQGSWYSIGASL